MPMFLIKVEVKPTDRNSQLEFVDKATAHCFVFGDSEAAALNKALFCVFRDEWETMNSTPSIEIVEEGTVNSDFWQTQFAKAKQYSMATVYVGQSRDGQTGACQQL